MYIQWLLHKPCNCQKITPFNSIKKKIVFSGFYIYKMASPESVTVVQYL